ncbi:MAG: hypothetical protein H7831_06635, partial [Magnetococcus sp. WYHC-3]
MPTILPDGRNAFLPITPTDGQIFIDSHRIKWEYDAETKTWAHKGIADDIPLATATNDGLLSNIDKNFLNGVPAVPGAFGIITDT